MKEPLLGGLKPNAFLRRHWQKRPLFVRQAMPGFRGAMDLRSLLALAARPDTESRRVQRRPTGWETRHGPFAAKLRLKARNDSLLVSGVNLHVAAADALLREFAFVPQARLDDVMVSYATPGGGVGPHADSYDVFLLQGAGRRRWRFGPPGKPRRTATTEVIAAAGDLLYLPPGWLHDGVALEPCFTYSIGFRAPRGAELGAAFLDWLHERGLPDARYRDPGLVAAAHPGAIPGELRVFAETILDRISWNGADVLDFLGRYLTEPKAHVVFRPSRAARPLERSRVRLDPKTQFLYCGRRFFINGESFSAAAGAGALRELSDRRSIAGHRLASKPLSGLVWQWLRSGYAHLEKPARA